MIPSLFALLAAVGMNGTALFVVIALALLATAVGVAWPSPSAPLVCLELRQSAAITATTASVVQHAVPFPCRIIRIQAGVEAIDDATDVDIDVENGTTDLCDLLAVADGSAIVAGGVGDDPDVGVEDLAAGDILHLDVTITGGTSPVVTGCYARVWVQRLP